MPKKMLYILPLILLVVILYAGSYLWFRNSHTERWAVDGSDYVIFPQNKFIYYAFRPITYLDARTTGQLFHIGPH